MRAGTVALLVRFLDGDSVLEGSLSDDREIELLQKAVAEGEADPLASVSEHRERQKKEDEEFGDYVEELLSQPFLRPEIQEHGVQWLKSKIRIEQYQRTETEATRVIADYAYQIYRQNPKRTEFTLQAPTATVTIRVFVLRKEQESRTPQAA